MWRLVYAVRKRIQRDGWWACLMLLLPFAAPWEFVTRLLQPPDMNISDPVIRTSAYCAAFAWLFGAAAAIQSYRPGLIEPRPWLKRRRVIWTAGCTLTVLHIALAMHAGHGWSHEDAYRHTEDVGGVGEGVYANYLFAAAWVADVVWMWLAADAYRHRPRWVGFTIHGFLAFIVFNATVVFATSPSGRAVALLFAAGIGWLLVKRWCMRCRVPPERGTGVP